MELFCAQKSHSIPTKINQDNYTVGVNTVSHLKGLPAASSVYDSGSRLPWGCTEDSRWTMREWEGKELETWEEWERVRLLCLCLERRPCEWRKGPLFSVHDCGSAGLHSHPFLLVGLTYHDRLCLKLSQNPPFSLKLFLSGYSVTVIGKEK